ncbi:MAG TPA: phosphatase PAP2 family protein [Xanthobacteraceae bacterium]|nr:phosphatase PAP2 family protein [Xanthobacteraceae bacterium]
MSRRGLLVALAFAAVIGLLFGFFPELDLKISGLFYDPAAGKFPLGASPVLRNVRDAAVWIQVILAAPAVIALAMRFVAPRAKPWMSARAAIFVIATLALAPGLLVNGILKSYWDRPRPAAVTEFGGSERFVAWWDPRGQCVKNCSFVSGETSSAFWTLAPAALAPAPWRLFAYASAVAFGAGMGIVRLVMGGHFFTDVVFAGLFTFMIIVLMHAVIFQPKARDSEPKTEAASKPAA